MCLLFFKQKTAYEMRISDWSSDVCSSDLTATETCGGGGGGGGFSAHEANRSRIANSNRSLTDAPFIAHPLATKSVSCNSISKPRMQIRTFEFGKIGRASWRESVCQYG